MATRTLRFDNVTIGTDFNMEVAGITGAFHKVSATKATNLGSPNGEPFKVAARQTVTVYVPDPTPEELAANRLRILNYRLADMIESGPRAQEELTSALAKDLGWYGIFTGSGAIEAQMKAAAYLHVGTMALRVLNHAEGGIEKLTSKACRNAMRYARFGSHSTSAISNVAEEMQAAAWAEVAEACAWDRN